MCLWMSTPMNADPEVNAYLLVSAANWQRTNNRYFVLAIDHKSTIWNSHHMASLLADECVFHTTINMRKYEKRRDTCRRLTMCLVHNIPGNYVSYLGSARTEKETCDKTHITWYSDDHYPISFCNLAYKVVTEGIRNSEGIPCEIPVQMACNVRVMDEILDVLDDNELQQLGNDANTALAEVYSVFEDSYFHTDTVLDRDIRTFMNWVDSRPKGWTLDMKSEKAMVQCKWQLATLRKMRQLYFPGDYFEGCIISRGVPPVEVAQQGTILMWRKKRNKSEKPVIQYRHTVHYNLKHWNASLWSIVYFHSPIPEANSKENGGVEPPPFQPNVPTPPAGPPAAPGAPDVPSPKFPQVPKPPGAPNVPPPHPPVP